MRRSRAGFSAMSACCARRRALAAALKTRGLRAGDKVALLMPNGYQTASLFLGAMIGGFVVTPLNLRSSRAGLAYALDHCDCKILFASPAQSAQLAEALPLTSAQDRRRDDRCRCLPTFLRCSGGFRARAARRERAGAPDVHFRHDGHAEGRAAHPSQSRRGGGERRQMAWASPRRPGAELATALSHQRPGDRHARALPLGRQHRRAARLLGLELVGRCGGLSLHLDQHGADHHRLSLERGGRRPPRRFPALALRPLGLGALAAGASSRLRGKLRRAGDRGHGDDRIRLRHLLQSDAARAPQIRQRRPPLRGRGLHRRSPRGANCPMARREKSGFAART